MTSYHLCLSYTPSIISFQTMEPQKPTKIEFPWDQNDGVINLKKNAPNDSRASLHGKMKATKPVALMMRAPNLAGVVNQAVLTDG